MLLKFCSTWYYEATNVCGCCGLMWFGSRKSHEAFEDIRHNNNNVKWITNSRKRSEGCGFSGCWSVIRCKFGSDSVPVAARGGGGESRREIFGEESTIAGNFLSVYFACLAANHFSHFRARLFVLFRCGAGVSRKIFEVSQDSIRARQENGRFCFPMRKHRNESNYPTFLQRNEYWKSFQ